MVSDFFILSSDKFCHIFWDVNLTFNAINVYIQAVPCVHNCSYSFIWFILKF